MPHLHLIPTSLHTPIHPPAPGGSTKGPFDRGENPKRNARGPSRPGRWNGWTAHRWIRQPHLSRFSCRVRSSWFQSLPSCMRSPGLDLSRHSIGSIRLMSPIVWSFPSRQLWIVERISSHPLPATLAPPTPTFDTGTKPAAGLAAYPPLPFPRHFDRLDPLHSRTSRISAHLTTECG